MTDWHAQTVGTVLDALESSPDGLSTTEAASRLKRDGPNRLPAGTTRGVLARLAGQIHNLLIYVLLASALVSLLLGHTVDAVVILAVVAANAVIGFVQEGRAEEALRAIQGMIDPKSSVLRDGRRITIPADEIVLGDIVLIESGDRVTADLRLLRARNLRIDEAILTGESVPTDKHVEPAAPGAALGDRASMAFSGTFVTAGHGAGVVVAVAGRTELGRISAMLRTVEVPKTPLLRQMDGFARQLTLITLGISVLAFLFAVLVSAYSLTDAFMAVVGLAVAAIPEGLPAILTITLAIGVKSMASRQAIIRRLPAVETLGSVSVICSDKTGTLTRNEMTTRSVVTAEAGHVVTGVGYEPYGVIQATDRAEQAATDPAAEQVLHTLVTASVLCNDAELRERDGTWLVDGDPMEGALVVLGRKAGLDETLLRRQFPRTDEIPFDAQHRFMATLHHGHEDGSFIVIKGAPERILAMCARERRADGDRPIDQAGWRDAADRLAAQGQRVLAFATRQGRPNQQDLTFDDVEQGAVLLGLTGFIDPPRTEAIAAVAECRAAGIRVVMITGDHAITAREIGRQLGLAEAPIARSGQDLDALDDDALRIVARETTIFARTTPEHKLRLVRALQDDGLTVAMTGDGVNDAPALKRADVGIAMGQKGTEVAKEASEMVLADDNFASIVAAVREGRTVYDNILKVIGWTLPTNGGEALTILAALGLGLALPVTPVQILWVNMVTAVALGLTLAFEPTEPGAMRRPPRPRNAPILTGDLLWRIGVVSILFVIGTFGMFFWAEARGLPIETARTLVVNTLVMMEIFYLFSVRLVPGAAANWRGMLGTPAVWIGVGSTVLAQIAFTYLPVMQVAFGTTAIGTTDVLAVIGVGATLLLVVELEKRLRAAFQKRRADRAGDPEGGAPRNGDPENGDPGNGAPRAGVRVTGAA
jgi:magnesium-transporting ATPase (P-type)